MQSVLRFICVTALITTGCTSESAPEAEDSSTVNDVSDAGATPDAGADAVADIEEAVDTPTPLDNGPGGGDGSDGPDLGPPPEGTCTCETATKIEWLKASSHSSCSAPSPANHVKICGDAKTQEFETGDTFGVKGCKFEVTCP